MNSSNKPSNMSNLKTELRYSLFNQRENSRKSNQKQNKYIKILKNKNLA